MFHLPGRGPCPFHTWCRTANATADEISRSGTSPGNMGIMAAKAIMDHEAHGPWKRWSVAIAVLITWMLGLP